MQILCLKEKLLVMGCFSKVFSVIIRFNKSKWFCSPYSEKEEEEMQLTISSATKLEARKFFCVEEINGVFVQTSREETFYFSPGVHRVEEVTVRLWRDGEMAPWIVISSLLGEGVVFGLKAQLLQYWADSLMSEGVRLYLGDPIRQPVVQIPLGF